MKWLPVLGLLAVTLVWGFYYLIVETLLRSGWDANWMNALRFSAGGLFLLVFVLLRGQGRELIDMQRRQGWQALLISSLGVVLGIYLLTAGQEEVASGTVGVLSSLTVLFAALLGAAAFFGRRRLALPGWCGIALGLLGLALVYSPFGDGLYLPGVSLVVLASFLFALEAHLFARFFSSEAFLPAVTLIVLWAGLGFFLLALGSPFEAGNWPLLLLLAFVSNAAIYFLYLWLVLRRGATFANLYSYLVPPVALLAGVLLNAERPSSWVLLGGALCLLGALLVGFFGKGVSRPEKDGVAEKELKKRAPESSEELS